MSRVASWEEDLPYAIFAAFSNVLASFYEAPCGEARLRALVRELPFLINACNVVIGREATPALKLPSQEYGDQRRAALTLPIPGTARHLTLRHPHGFGARERFLIQQLQLHLGAAFSASSLGNGVTPEPAMAPERLQGLGLTKRESEVLYALMRGRRNAEIAGILRVASRTVSKHVENILRKLHVETRLAAARVAADWLAARGSHPSINQPCDWTPAK